VFVPGRGDGVVHEFDRELDPIAVHDGFSRPVDVLEVADDWWVLDASARDFGRSTARSSRRRRPDWSQPP